MLTKKNQKLFITDGARVGWLTVGDLIRNVKDHPLYVETPISYLKQGRLREVHCDCGGVRLIAESILSTGRVQSCGCMRREIIANAQEGKIKHLRLKAQRAEINHRIQVEQSVLKQMQLVRIPYRDELGIRECGARLRKLFAQKQQLNRKESHKEAWKRNNSGILPNGDKVGKSRIPYEPQEQPK